MLSPNPNGGWTCPEIHDFQMKSITGEEVSLSQYDGQVCLIVNVASE